MRIIAGIYKGRTLCEFKGDSVRPTSDKARESLFNIISLKVKDASFLDLFCGTGAVGIEAKSQGASKVFFNDYSKESINLTKHNLEKVGFKDAVVTQGDSILFLKTTKEKFNIVFIDPPYQSTLGIQALELVSNVLTEDGIAIFESETEFTRQINGLEIYDKRKYGRVRFTFFKKSKNIKSVKENKNCVFAGTFDPITKGHEHFINNCLNQYDKVFVVVGENQHKKAFFSEEERYNLLKETFNDSDRIIVVKYSEHRDNYANFLQQNNITIYVRGIRNAKDLEFESKAININKKLYPFVETIFINAEKEFSKFSSTDVRTKILQGQSIKEDIPEKCYKLLCKYKKQKIKQIKLG